MKGIFIALLMSHALMATLIHDAARMGDWQKVQGFLDDGADVEERDSSQQTPLMAAVKNTVEFEALLNSNEEYSSLKTVKILLERGAHIDTRNPDGWNALMFAVLFGQIDMVRNLHALGADINARTNEQWTPLIIASYAGEPEIVSLLLDLGANVLDKSKHFRTCIKWASHNGFLDVMEVIHEWSVRKLIRLPDEDVSLLAKKGLATVDGYNKNFKIQKD